MEGDDQSRRRQPKKNIDKIVGLTKKNEQNRRIDKFAEERQREVTTRIKEKNKITSQKCGDNKIN